MHSFTASYITVKLGESESVFDMLFRDIFSFSIALIVSEITLEEFLQLFSIHVTKIYKNTMSVISKSTDATEKLIISLKFISNTLPDSHNFTVIYDAVNALIQC